MKQKYKKGISPIRFLPLGYLCVILLGTLLLSLPIAVYGSRLTFFEALFTSTSASCVTGLVVVDTGTKFTFFGQFVLLLLIQLGGLGFMVVATAFFMALKRKRISLKERMTLAESMGEDRLQGVVNLAKMALKLSLTIEAVGAVLYSIRFIPDFGFAKGVWYSIFHSVSAFCNAGFDLIGNYSSFTSYVSSPIVNITTMMLIILGGLGFAVLMDLLEKPKRKHIHFRLHTKVVLRASFILLFTGALIFFALEYNNADTIGEMSIPQKIMASLFQSTTCRTAGFNTIDQNGLTDASKLISVILMFIGGAPAGTAGGIKVTTIAVILISVRSFIQGFEDDESFGRRLSRNAVRRAICIFIIGFLVLILSVLAISVAESPIKHTFLNKLYEVASALGTVGLTVGVTAEASFVTQIILCILMYTGRVGILTLALAFGGKEVSSKIRYPEEDMMVG